MNIPPAGSYSGTLTFPASSVAYAQVITLKSSAGACQSGVTAAVFCITLNASSAVTLPGFPALSLTLPTGSPTTGYAVGFYDPTQPAAGLQSSSRSIASVAGTVAVANNTLTTTGTSTPLTLQANTNYVIVVTDAPSASPAPSTSPTGTPTNAPSTTPTVAPTTVPTTAPTAAPTAGPVVANPNAIGLSALGQTATFTASQSPSGGTLTATSSNGSVATVATSDNKAFTVTAVAAGTAVITVTAGNAQTTVQVTVTTTGFSVN